MMVWLESILKGFSIYQSVALAAWMIFTGIAMISTRKVNIVRGFLNQMFLLYMCCVIGLVFFPLPTMEQVGQLTYQIQGIPFYWIVDFVKEPGIRVVANVVMNVIMTIPFGMYVRYRFGLDAKSVIIMSFLLSFVIEFGQLTGLFFRYNGSYRLCDVDDLITNTFGGWIGYCLMNKFQRVLPELSAFDMKFSSIAHILE